MNYEKLKFDKKLSEIIKSEEQLKTSELFNGFFSFYDDEVYLFLGSYTSLKKANHNFTHIYSKIKNSDYYKLIFGLLNKEEIYQTYLNQWKLVDLEKRESDYRISFSEIKKTFNQTEISESLKRDLSYGSLLYYTQQDENKYSFFYYDQLNLNKTKYLILAFKDVFSSYIEEKNIVFSNSEEEILVMYAFICDFFNYPFDKDELMSFPYLFEMKNMIKKVDKNYFLRNHKDWINQFDTNYKSTIEIKAKELERKDTMNYNASETLSIMRNTLAGRKILQKQGIF